MARIHNAGESCRVAHHRPAPRLGPSYPPGGARACSRSATFCRRAARRRFPRGGPGGRGDLRRVEPSDVPVHPIHGDCHLGNLLLRRPGLVLSRLRRHAGGPRGAGRLDAAAGARRHEAERQRAAAGRRLSASFATSMSVRSLRLVEPLRAFRFVWYAGWIAQALAGPRLSRRLSPLRRRRVLGERDSGPRATGGAHRARRVGVGERARGRRARGREEAEKSWLARWADHPGSAWVRQIYRQHRQP